MDLEMPIMDGLKATKKIRKYQQKQIFPNNFKIIAYTAYLDERDNCLNNGMNDFMVKPTKLKNLKEIITKHMQ